jgi:hypothetical protein
MPLSTVTNRMRVLEIEGSVSSRAGARGRTLGKVA